MVRLITFNRSFDLDVQSFFRVFWLSSSFAVELHKSLGDTNVDASDWIAIGPSKAQRLLFFGRLEDGQVTKCIETQSYSLKEDGNFDIKVSVNPENPLGQIFSIVANWSVRADKETTVVDITLEIECKKRLWGGYGNSLVEGILEKSARKEYDDWFNRCEQEVRKIRSEASAPAAKSDDVRLAVEEAPKAPSVFNRHAIRQKTSSIGHAAVRGAERFMEALMEHSGVEEGDRPLIHIDVDGRRNLVAPVVYTQHKRPLSRRPVFVVMLLGVLISMTLLWWLIH